MTPTYIELEHVQSHHEHTASRVGKVSNSQACMIHSICEPHSVTHKNQIFIDIYRFVILTKLTDV